MHMLASSHKSILLVTGLFISGFLFGQFWRYLGDNDAIINRYLEAHNARFISENELNQKYFVFYNDIVTFTDYVNKDDRYIGLKPAGMSNLATIEILNSSLPTSLNDLRGQAFIRFIFPGTFPFICH